MRRAPRIAMAVALTALVIACGAGDGGARADDPVETGTAPPPPESGGGERATPTGPAPAKEPSPPVGPPAVRIVGRLDTRDAAEKRCAWSGCRIVARFDGTAVSVRLAEDQQSWQEGPSEWDVTVDGVRSKLVLEAGERDYALAEGLEPGSHTVELYKRSEAQEGVTRFLGFDLHGGELLAPPPAATRRMEVIGDSDVSGYGLAGVGTDCAGPHWAARWQSFRDTWPARAAEAFGADLHGTVYSGKGVLKNAWRPDTETMPLLYPRADPLDPTSVFDLTSFVPDVVLVVLGGNDFNPGQPVDDGPPSVPEFTAAYDAFVAQLRGAYPQAHLFLTLPSMLTDDPGRPRRQNVWAGIQAVVQRRADAGDLRVHGFAPTPATPGELDACGWHGGLRYHARVAAELLPLVEEKTGWQRSGG